MGGMVKNARTRSLWFSSDLKWNVSVVLRVSLTLWTCSQCSGPSQQCKPRLGHTSENVGERISFNPLLIALSNSLAFRAHPLPPLFFTTLYLLIPLHSPEESSLCAGAGRQTEAERWIRLRVTWFCLCAWPLSKYRDSALLSLCLQGGTLHLSPLLLYTAGCKLKYLPGLSKKCL